MPTFDFVSKYPSWKQQRLLKIKALL